MRLIGVVLFIVFALSRASAAPQDDTVRLAQDAYIFGFPLVIMGLTEEVSLTRSELNQFEHLREFPDYTFRTVVRPNADTLYSIAWLDTGTEPVILSVPNTGDRYYLMQFMDAWTNTFAVPGTRTTGNRAGNFAIVGPKWNGRLPQGVTVLHSPTSMVWLVGRIQTNTPSDYPFVRSLQDQFHLTRFSDWGKPTKPAVQGVKPDSTRRTPSAEIDKMDAATFFGHLCRLMQRNPPAAADAPLVRRMAKIGIEPAERFDFTRFSAETRQAIERGVADARQALFESLPAGKKVDGWSIRYDMGKYDVDYSRRAQVARMGLGANLPEDAIYPRTLVDADGSPLEGSRRYVVHFDKGQLPPVNAFWSLTVYDSRGFFSENPIGRYAIGDRDHLRYNPDGSLDLYIQHARPGAEKESNWLPAPIESFEMALRLYWPKPNVLDGTWTPPPIRHVD
jgi:hypothetical protein